MESKKNKQSFKFISYTKLKLPLSLSFANKMDCFLIKCFYHYFTKYRQNDQSRKSTMLAVLNSFSTCNYMSTVTNRKTRTTCEICSKLTIKTPERHHCLRSVVFIVNFKLISHIVLVFLLFNLSRYMSAVLSILCSLHKQKDTN